MPLGVHSLPVGRRQSLPLSRPVLGLQLPTTGRLWWPEIKAVSGGSVFALSPASSLGSLCVITPLCRALFSNHTSGFRTAASASARRSPSQSAGRRKGESKSLPPPLATSRHCTHFLFLPNWQDPSPMAEGDKVVPEGENGHY